MMTNILTSPNDRQVLTASPDEVRQARDVVCRIGEWDGPTTVSSRSGREVAIPPELASIIARVLEILSTGGTVTVGSMPENLTTTAAANMLGVSRPTLMKMVERGEVSAFKVGTHSRLRSEDVLALRKSRRDRQRAAFDALRALEDE